ncbi:MAG: cation:proton antiporter [Planctomycetes bacterium]|nr:cation:proton antiporter [Planctomycetota bacterium]
MPAAEIARDVLLILAAGLGAGMICKRFGVSLLVGYLVAGAIVGEGILGLIGHGEHEMEDLASIGALLLLFAIGIEFTLEEIARMSRFFLLGGSVQMVLVAAPVMGFCLVWDPEMNWRTALLIGWAVAFSSTVLVFKALAEWGATASPHGRRAIGVLLFQDVALAPMILLIPLLTGAGDAAGVREFSILGLKSLAFIAVVWGAHFVMRRWLVPLIAGLRSAELAVLFTLTVLMAMCLGATIAGLPAALGAFAAGLVLSGTRLSAQIDALILPFRESFAAVFFVSLGTLLRPSVLFAEPVATIFVLAGVILCKTIAGGAALRLVGLKWRSALGMGLGLAQLGEFSFVLLNEGLRHEVLSPLDYNRVLFIALGTLILTPQLLKTGLRFTEPEPEESHDESRGGLLPQESVQSIVVGLGPAGHKAASLLETAGGDVCVVDLSPVNLYPFAQQGFRNITGDATDAEVLHRAGIEQCRLLVVTIPDDRAARRIVVAARRINRNCAIIARCRYQASIAPLRRAGAAAIVCDESETGRALLETLLPAAAEALPAPAETAAENPEVRR